MKWWRGALGLDRDTIEKKEIIGMGALAEWAGVSRQDGQNFRTNMVTLAQYMDAPRGNALGLAATYACVNLLAGTQASLPLMVYRTDAAGVRTVAKDHPLYFVLHDSPNYDQTAVDFWEFMCAGIELHGNGYAVIATRTNGEINSLTPVRPDIVTVKRDRAGKLEYSWAEGGRTRVYTQESILHIRGFGGSPEGGASTLAACRQTFAGALAAEGAANSMFANGAMPSGVLSTDKTFTPDQRKLAEELLTEKFVGALNAGRPMLLDNGLKWDQLTISPEDAQMLETRRFGVEEICRVFGVPPHMIGHTENSTSWGTGLEQQTLGFVKFTLRRRLKRIEQALEKQLLPLSERRQGVTIEFNLEGLLRGDSAGRSAFYQTMTQMGAMTVNEVRALENLPPIAGGDVARVQMQNQPLTAQENADAA
jgi:HK97 family phage portal protein